MEVIPVAWGTDPNEPEALAELGNVLTYSNYFQWISTQYSAGAQTLGPISIDPYVRNITAYNPSKSIQDSDIQKTLLNAMNDGAVPWQNAFSVYLYLVLLPPGASPGTRQAGSLVCQEPAGSAGITPPPTPSGPPILSRTP